MKKIGDRIRAERERQGLTQDELAKRLGYAYRSSVNKLENKESIKTKTLLKVADALGVTPSVLMGWEDESPSPKKPEEPPVNKEFQILSKAMVDASDDDIREVYQYYMYLKQKRDRNQ